MIENTIMGYEYYPTSQQRRNDTEKIMEGIIQSRKKEIGEFRDQLKKVEVKNKKFERIIEAAKQDLIGLYAKVGVKIQDEDFPTIYLIPYKYKKQFSENKQEAGSFQTESMAAIVYIIGSYLALFDIRTIHHELHHGIGRVALITEDENDEIIIFGQLGHLVSSPKRKTGEALEEAIVTNFAKKFIIDSNQPDIVRARKKYAGAMGYKYGEGNVNRFERLLGVKNPNRAREIIQNLDRGDELPERRDSRAEAVKMVVNLINRAAKIDGNQGRQKMRNLLLRSRRFPKERRKLVEYINNLFGPDAARYIFGAHDDFDQLILVNRILESISKTRDTINN